jgi:hypothetical protein
MQKYKLIKEYPGSPKLGVIYREEKESTGYFRFYDGTDEIKGYHLVIKKEGIKNYPEFWEEVEELCVPVGTRFYHKDNQNLIFTIKEIVKDDVTISWYVDRTLVLELSKINTYFKTNQYLVYDKDYEILTFERTGSINYNGTKFHLNEQKSYYCSFNKGKLSLQHCLKEGSRIYSVKRTKDNQIFTIGDRVNISNSIGRNLKIRGFEKRNDILCVSISDEFDKGYCDNKGCNIDIVEHSKVLFTTEDKVDIFENDKVHWVCIVGEIKYLYAIQFHKNHLNLDFTKTYKIFSTKEKAESYVFSNTKCLSFVDVDQNVQLEFAEIFKLSKLVKSRVNG